IEDFQRQKRWQRIFLVDLDKPSEGRVIWERNNQDRYKDPGTPLSGPRGILHDGANIFLTSVGSSPTGDHPFLDRFNLATLKTEPSTVSEQNYSDAVGPFRKGRENNSLPRRESPAEPPNYFVRTPSGSMTAMTKFPDPQPSIRAIHKELVKYKRDDGVELSFTL